MHNKRGSEEAVRRPRLPSPPHPHPNQNKPLRGSEESCSPPPPLPQPPCRQGSRAAASPRSARPGARTTPTSVSASLGPPLPYLPRLAPPPRFEPRSDPLPVSQGFVARPETLADGSANLMTWNCTIPGKQGVSTGNTSSIRLDLIRRDSQEE